MWPFRKDSTAIGDALISDCTSGVLTCDGKHHVWSAWRDIVLSGVAWKPGMGEPIEYFKNAQERHCIVCNYKERREL